jgi:hypothetical protein
MFPCTRSGPSALRSLQGCGAVGCPQRPRVRGSCNALIALELFFAGLCLTADSAPPGLEFHPGYGSSGDPSARQAQIEGDYRGTWHAFRTTTQDLMKTLGARNSEATSRLVQIQTNAAFLDAKWTTWFNTHRTTSQYALHDEYLVALHGDVRVLRNLKKQVDAQASLAALRDVALDLQIKADNCRHSADGLGKEIKVRVHTKAEGKEVGGFEVHFVPKGLLDVKNAYDRFPRESSPTDETILNPGRYAMWASRKGFTGQPTTLSVGGHGEIRIEVDLEVPAD